jgi:hypothetical protein
MMDVLKSIITEEFEYKFKQNPDAEKKGMLISFRLRSPKENDWDNYYFADMFIFGCDYTGVFVRERKNSEVGEWKNKSYHDSCWRTDGVHSFLFEYRDRIEGLDTLGKHDWYETVDLTDEEVKKYMDIVYQKRNGGK